MNRSTASRTSSERQTARVGAVLAVACGLAAPGLAAEPSRPATTIDVAEFGAVADSGADATVALQRAIAAAATAGGPVVLKFHPGRYDLHPEQAARIDWHITNTMAESEAPDVTKIVGLYLRAMSGVTIDGNGALLMFHGKMLPLAFDHCQDVLIRDLHVDFARPTMSEMTLVAVGERSFDARVHPDSRYVIEQGRLFWVGEGWRHVGRAAQGYDRERDTTWRGWNPQEHATLVEELEPFLLRFTFAKALAPDSRVRVGLGFQIDDPIRDQVGVFMLRCRNIAWQDVGMHFMHGLGFVGQFSEDLSFIRVACEPRPETGRTCAGAADFMQFSGCRGKVSVIDSRFTGSHDDPINVHGTHLRIVGQPAPDQLTVRFMHAQTYGFDAFAAGDEIEFIRADTLLAYAAGKLKAATLVNPREMLLTLEQPAPAGIAAEDCVENVTWTPEVEISGCRFARDPTRGILVTTRRKVVISHNVFLRTTMSAILVSDDAHYWYESGPVRDLTISDNEFVECAEPVINILPENTAKVAGACVHRNIRIIDNVFRMIGQGAIAAKSTDGLTIAGNTFVVAQPRAVEELVQFKDCANVAVSGNRVEVAPLKP